jgi:tripartite ATP-independent transporter DctM subunit
MSTELVTIVLFGGLLLLLFAGVSVFYALGFISVVTTLLIGDTQDLYMVATTTYRQITEPGLMTIPLFILMGNFLLHSGISDRLFSALSLWMNNLRGGLAVISVGVCVALAMCGGFGPGILTMGLIAVPAMLNNKYDKSIALGSVMAGGVLGEIIPPSIIMIIFGYISRLSIGKLFFAGAVPGMITAFLYVVYITVRCHLQPHLAPKSEARIRARDRIKSIKDIIPPSLLVFCVLGSIFFGVATPSEAAGIGALGSILLCALYKQLNWEVIRESSLGTLKISGVALGILITATLFGIVYTDAGAQDMVMEMVSNAQVNRWVIIVVMQVILLVLGSFMDDYAVVTICAPIFLPIAVSLGFDPIWFGIIFILNMQVAYLTPPFGWALILMKSVAPPQIKTSHIWRAVPPFVAIQLLVLIITMIWPQVALWLPSRM